MDSKCKKILGFLLAILVLAVLGGSVWKKVWLENGPHSLGNVAEVPRLPSHDDADKRMYDFPLGDGAIFKQEKWDGQIYIVFGRMSYNDFQGFSYRFELQNQIMHTKHGLNGLHINDEITAR